MGEDVSRNQPIVLRGKAAEDFERYRKSKPTKEEIAYFKKCEKIYRDSCLPPKLKKTTGRRAT